MKYPKDIGPQSQTEALAILFSMLGNAYNLLAQYEADEYKRDEDERRRRFEEDLSRVKAETVGKREHMRSESSHREDEQQ